MRYSCTPAEEVAGKDRQTQIQSAITALNEADAFVQKVAAKRGQIESTLIQSWPTFDPMCDESIFERAETQLGIQVFDQWLACPPVLLRAVESLRLELLAVKPVIQDLAQVRCVAETNISKCFWSSRLAVLEFQPLRNQLRQYLDIAREVLSDLRVLLEARRGVQLTPDEIRTGVLQRELGRGNRALTPLERQNGVADE